MAVLRTYLFGGLRVYDGDEPLPPFPTQKTRSLFAYLVTFRDRRHAREDLAGIFWRDRPSPQARRRLSTTLWRLRRTLPPGYLYANEEVLAFDPSGAYWIDVSNFERALQQAGLSQNGSAMLAGSPRSRLECLQQAVELYRGDFLAGFYEDWCLVEAERLRVLYLQALGRLLSFHRSGGEYGVALELAQRLLEVDPLREEAHQQAMELYALLGQREQAMAQFETCRELLREELDVEPMPETGALYRRIRATDRGVVKPSPPGRSRAPRSEASVLPRTPFDDFGQVPLVGRKDVLATLTARITLAARNCSGIALIQGGAGEGKTRLVREFVRYAETQGWLPLWGSCPELKEPPPYQAWIEALRSALSWLSLPELRALPRPCLEEIALLLPELSRLLPDLVPPAVPPLQQQEQLCQALRRFLVGLGRIRPCLVILEDLQWADEATLEALRGFTQVQDTPLMILLTARLKEISPALSAALAELSKGEGFQHYELGPLVRAEVGELTGALLGWSTPETLFVERLHAETGGNAFYVIESLKGLYEQGLLSRDSRGQWHLHRDAAHLGRGEWPLPRGICQVVHRRLGRLSRPENELLELAAVLGKGMSFDLLWQFSGWSEEQVLEVTDELLRRQFLVEEEDDLGFMHDHIRQAIYQGIGSARRQKLHRRAGDVLEAYDPGQVEALAHHFFLGRLPERALPYCLQAGNRAKLLYANQSALTYYNWAIEAALKMTPLREVLSSVEVPSLPGRASPGDADGPVLVRLGGAGFSAQDGDCVAYGPELLDAYERRGHVWEHLGECAQALDDYATMCRVAAIISDWAAVARAWRRAAWVRGAYLGDWDKGLAGAYRAWKLARDVGDLREAAIALLDTGFFHNMRGEHRQALDALQRAGDLSCEIGETGPGAASLHYIGMTHQALGQYEKSLAAFQDARQVWVDRGNRRAEARTLNNIGELYLKLGDLDQAERLFLEARSILDDIAAYLGVPYAFIGLASAQRWRGACAESLQWLAQAARVAQNFGQSSHSSALELSCRGLVHWDRGQIGAGMICMQQALEQARQSGTRTLVVELLNDLGGGVLALGQIERAAACYQESLDLAGEAAFRSGEVQAWAGLGLVKIAQGDIPGGRAALARAVFLARTLGPVERAGVLVTLAEGCLADWDLEPARALARHARGLIAQMGLRPLQVRLLNLQGWALSGLGRTGEAGTILGQALREADPPGYPMQCWQILLGLANVRAELGEEAESLRLRQQAAQLVEGILDSLKDRDLRRSFTSQVAVQALLGRVETDPLPAGLVRTRIATLGAPTGRPLRREEQVTVLWTAQLDPLPDENKVSRRRRHLLRLLSEAYLQGGDPTEADLAGILAVSTRTARSDVAALRQAGRRIRTRGRRGLA